MTDPAPTLAPEFDADHARGRVLVIDDNLDNLDVVSRRLGRFGLEVRVAHDGQAGLAEIATFHPDLVLLDWMMPRMSGLEVLQAIRKSHAPTLLSVIMLTARDDDASVVEAFEHGANDFIAKPFSFDVLHARVRGQIERVQAVRALEGIMHDCRESGAGLPGSGVLSEQFVTEAVIARKKAEDALREALDAAEAGLRSKKAFLRTLCHELRTPLNTVIGYAEMLGEHVAKDQKLWVDTVTLSGRQLLGVLNNAIAVARLQHEDPPVTAKPVNIIDIVQEAATLSLGERGTAPGGVDISAGQFDPTVEGDQTLLRQVFMGLISNGLKFSTDTPSVEITIAEHGANVVKVVIEDAGVGLPDGDVPRLFEPFERGLRPDADRFGGLGIGLSIAQRYVRAHGGTLTLVNRESGGARATVTLPRTQPESGVMRNAA